MNYINTFFSDIIHLVYPDTCAGCGSDLLSVNQIICIDCIHQLPETGFYRHAQNPVEKIFRGRVPVVSAFAHVYFNKDSSVQHLLHRLKYGNRKDIGVYMGRLMGEKLKSMLPPLSVDALIPLPLNLKKQRIRGYNQAALICEGISGELNIPVLDNVIIRRKNTESQTRKSRAERWNNIEGKFELVNAEAIVNKHILLVDDVITTGATLESCGAEILKSTGTRLSIAAFAYTTL